MRSSEARSVLAAASLAAIGLAGTWAALPFSDARADASRKSQVGTVTAVSDMVYLGRHWVPDSAAVSAGSVLSTRHEGHATLTLKTKKTECDVYHDANMTVMPGSGVIWYDRSGSVSCGTDPKSKRKGRFKGKRGLEISSKDPVFELVNRPGRSIVKVTRGFVVVRGLHRDQTAVIVARNQQVVVPAGGDPGAPAGIQLSARERSTLARLAARFRQSSDRRPPQATILEGPPQATAETTATFAFGADEPGASFACQLDGGGFHPCSSPQSYDGLAEGGHTFAVQAIDAAGNLGAAATHSWVVDTTPPTSSITCDGAACGNALIGKPVSVALAATDSGSGVARIRFTTDGSEATTANGLDYSGPLIVQSATVVRYRAYDKAGNAEATHQQALDVDAVPPTVAFSSPKPDETVPADVTFSASATDAALDRVELLLDGTLVGTLKSAPYSLQYAFGSGQDGPHTATARAYDAAGNVAEASVRFVVALPNLTVAVDEASISQSCSQTLLLDASTTCASFTITNDRSKWGASAAGPFDVLMEASSGAAKTLQVDGLAAGESRTFTNEQLPGTCFTDLGCTIKVTVDSNGAVAESREDDNVDEKTAPPYSPSPG